MFTTYFDEQSNMFITEQRDDKNHIIYAAMGRSCNESQRNCMAA
jgi:hypothetical protein